MEDTDAPAASSADLSVAQRLLASLTQPPPVEPPIPTSDNDSDLEAPFLFPSGPLTSSTPPQPLASTGPNSSASLSSLRASSSSAFSSSGTPAFTFAASRSYDRRPGRRMGGRKIRPSHLSRAEATDLRRRLNASSPLGRQEIYERLMSRGGELASWLGDTHPEDLINFPLEDLPGRLQREMHKHAFLRDEPDPDSGSESLGPSNQKQSGSSSQPTDESIPSVSSTTSTLLTQAIPPPFTASLPQPTDSAAPSPLLVASTPDSPTSSDSSSSFNSSDSDDLPPLASTNPSSTSNAPNSTPLPFPLVPAAPSQSSASSPSSDNDDLPSLISISSNNSTIAPPTHPQAPASAPTQHSFTVRNDSSDEEDTPSIDGSAPAAPSSVPAQQPPTSTSEEDDEAVMPELVTIDTRQHQTPAQPSVSTQINPQSAEPNPVSSPDMNMPDLIPIIPTSSAAIPSSMPSTNNHHSSDDFEDELPPLAPISQTSTAPPSSTQIQHNPSSDSDNEGMPSLRSIHPPPASRTQAPGAAASNNDEDSMPPLIPISSSISSKPPAPKPTSGIPSRSIPASLQFPFFPREPSSSRTPILKHPHGKLHSFTSELYPTKSVVLTVSKPPHPDYTTRPTPRPVTSPSLSLLPADILHSIAFFLVDPPYRDLHECLVPTYPTPDIVNLCSTSRQMRDELGGEIWRCIRVRGDEESKKFLDWIVETGGKDGEGSSIGRFVRYVDVLSLCGLHNALVQPLADALKTFTSLRHVWWRAQASFPPCIIRSISLQSSTLTGLSIWRHALNHVHLFPPSLNLKDIDIIPAPPADHCDDMMDPEVLLLMPGETGEEGETVAPPGLLGQADRQTRRRKRIFREDMKSFRVLLGRNAETIENLAIQTCFGGAPWLPMVIGPSEPSSSSSPGSLDSTSPSSRLILPNLRTLKIPGARLTSSAFTHLLETSPDLEHLCCQHAFPLDSDDPHLSPDDAQEDPDSDAETSQLPGAPPGGPSSEIASLGPRAPPGSLTKLKYLHYRTSNANPHLEQPVGGTLDSFLAGGEGRPLLEELEIGTIKGDELLAVLKENNMRSVKFLDVFVTTPIERKVLTGIVKACPKLETLILNAYEWTSTMSTVGACLSKLAELTSLTINHSIAKTVKTRPVPSASHLVMNGYASDEIEEQLEAYVESNLKRWTKFFESNLAVCCPKLNNLNWAASEEVLFRWKITSSPPLRSSGSYVSWSELPFAIRVRRCTLTHTGPSIDLGPWQQVADQGPLGGLGAGLMAALGGGPGGLLEILGMGVVGGGAGFGFGIGGGLGGGFGAFGVPAGAP